MMRVLKPGTVTLRWMRAGVALALALACAAVFIVGSPTQVNAADAAITIDKFTFMPGTITIPVGTRVVWTNLETSAPHDVTSDTGVFASGSMTTGQTFSYTFMQPGTFAYSCTIHPRMKATITVVAATGGGQANAVTAPTTAAPAAVVAPAPTRAPAPIPAGMPRTGGGAMATRFTGDSAPSSLPLILAMSGLLALIAGGAAVYVRSRHVRGA